MATSYINAAGGAGKYTTLAAWWTAVKGSSDPVEEAVLESDLSGAQSVSTAGTNNKKVLIRSDGTRRTITTNTGNAALSVTPAVAVELEIDGVTLNGNGVNSCLSLGAPQTTVTLRNCICKNASSTSVTFGSVTTGLVENCLFLNNGNIGLRLACTTAANTNTVTHCGFYGNATGLNCENNSNITLVVNNSWSLNNSTADFNPNAATTTTIRNSVTSDSSANSASWDSKTSTATAQTSYASYFTDAANGDFSLLDDDEALWGINSNSTYSPATDIDGTTRATYDIGPYEFAGADPPTISSVTITGTSQIGQTLTATVVTDMDPPTSTAYQWQKAATDDAEPGTDISGETSQTLALTYADFGDLLDTAAYVRCQAIATKNELDSDEVASAWQAVTVGSGSGSGGSLLESSLIR